MSRIGKKPIPVPAGVQVKITPGSVELKGPQGSFQQKFPSQIQVELDTEKKEIRVKRPDDTKLSRACHGLTRALVANAVKGVSEGFEKTLDIQGTGYNAKLKGKQIEINLGWIHPALVAIPDELKVTVPAPNRILIRGCDKYLVGQFAANTRGIRPPDPYKGKGIRYLNEVIKLKTVKSVGAGKT